MYSHAAQSDIDSDKESSRIGMDEDITDITDITMKGIPWFHWLFQPKFCTISS